MLLAGGFALYTYESLAEASARDSGHLVLGTPACRPRRRRAVLQHGLSGVQKLRATLLADPAVRHALPRVAFTGLISNGGDNHCGCWPPGWTRTANLPSRGRF